MGNTSKDLSAEDINKIWCKQDLQGVKTRLPSTASSPRRPAAAKQSWHLGPCSLAQADDTLTVRKFSSQNLRAPGAVKHAGVERGAHPVASPLVLQTVAPSKAMHHTAPLGTTQLPARGYTKVDPMTASLGFSNMKSL